MSDRAVTNGNAIIWGVVGEHAVFSEEGLVGELIRARKAIGEAATW